MTVRTHGVGAAALALAVALDLAYYTTARPVQSGTTAPAPVLGQHSMAAEALVFQPGELELGRIPLGESRAFEATVRNSSHEVVRIEGIVPGC